MSTAAPRRLCEGRYNKDPLSRPVLGHSCWAKLLLHMSVSLAVLVVCVPLTIRSTLKLGASGPRPGGR
jgi:hypothetical protein